MQNPVSTYVQGAVLDAGIILSSFEVKFCLFYNDCNPIYKSSAISGHHVLVSCLNGCIKNAVNGHFSTRLGLEENLVFPKILILASWAKWRIYRPLFFLRKNLNTENKLFSQHFAGKGHTLQISKEKFLHQSVKYCHNINLHKRVNENFLSKSSNTFFYV